jgi:hypothetical protein
MDQILEDFLIGPRGLDQCRGALPPLSGPQARTASIAVYAPVAKNGWRRVEGSNPVPRIAAHPRFSGPVAGLSSGTLLKRQEPPRLIAGRLSCALQICSSAYTATLLAMASER